MPRLTWQNGFWLAAYLAAMTMAIVLLVRERAAQTTALDSTDARQDWQVWQNDASEMDDRRPPKSNEPPWLVLLRDHFVALLAGTIVIGSAAFVMFMFLLRGVFSRGPEPYVSPEDGT
jgi:hypothetical protein